MTQQSPGGQHGFGKRGRVELSAPPSLPQVSGPSSRMKWIGGGLAALLIAGLFTGATGGGGLIGGLLGGLIGHHLFNRTAATAPASQAPGKAAPASTSVQRSGFGSTGSSSGFFSGG